MIGRFRRTMAWMAGLLITAAPGVVLPHPKSAKSGSGSRRRCLRRAGRSSSASCCERMCAPARSSTHAISTNVATSNASSAGAATMGRMTRSRMSTTGRCCMPLGAPIRFSPCSRRHGKGICASIQRPGPRTCLSLVMGCTTRNSLSCSTGSITAKGSRSSTSRGSATRRTIGSNGGSSATRGSTWATIPARPTMTRSSRSSAACSTAAAALCSARRPRSTGPAIRSTSKTASTSDTVNTATPRCSNTSGTTTTSSATAR